MKYLLVILFLILCSCSINKEELLSSGVKINSDKGYGSGSIIYSDESATFILTAYHVIEGTSCISVDLYEYVDGHRFYTGTAEASIFKTDIENDLALLLIHDGIIHHTLDVAEHYEIKLSDTIYIISCPVEVDPIITTGYITDTYLVLDNKYFILNTANITYGSSGGALLNEDGNIIGVVEGGFQSHNLPLSYLGFSIPLERILTFLYGN